METVAPFMKLVFMATIIVLILGLGSLGFGSDERADLVRSNRLMRLRVEVQAVALALVLIAIFIEKFW